MHTVCTTALLSVYSLKKITSIHIIWRNKRQKNVRSHERRISFNYVKYTENKIVCVKWYHTTHTQDTDTNLYICTCDQKCDTKPRDMPLFVCNIIEVLYPSCVCTRNFLYFYFYAPYTYKTSIILHTKRGISRGFVSHFWSHVHMYKFVSVSWVCVVWYHFTQTILFSVYFT
jgi:hypothetical protein